MCENICLQVGVVYVIQKSKQIRTKTIKKLRICHFWQLCMSFKKVNKYGLKQSCIVIVCVVCGCVCHSKK